MPGRLKLPTFRKGLPEGEAEPVAEPVAVPGLEPEEDKATMRRKRLVRLASVLLIALGTGQYMQSARTAGANAASVAHVGPVVEAKAPAALAAPQAVLLPVVLAKAVSVQGGAGLGVGAEAVVPVAAEADVTMPTLPQMAAAPDCGVSLDLAVEPGAMLGLSLVAPCHANERVVLRHAGLAVTGLTNAAGGLFVTLPALAADGSVEVGFADGSVQHAAMAVPELAGMRRMGIQWQAGDAFALAGTDDGRLDLLGEPGVEAALLAQVYTFGAAGGADVAIEARVGPQTCGREMLGQTLDSRDGVVTVTDLTLAMPDCGGEVGYLVLKNLFGDMKIAAGN